MKFSGFKSNLGLNFGLPYQPGGRGCNSEAKLPPPLAKILRITSSVCQNVAFAAEAVGEEAEEREQGGTPKPGVADSVVFLKNPKIKS